MIRLLAPLIALLSLAGPALAEQIAQAGWIDESPALSPLFSEAGAGGGHCPYTGPIWPAARPVA